MTAVAASSGTEGTTAAVTDGGGGTMCGAHVAAQLVGGQSDVDRDARRADLQILCRTSLPQGRARCSPLGGGPAAVRPLRLPAHRLPALGQLLGRHILVVSGDAQRCPRGPRTSTDTSGVHNRAWLTTSWRGSAWTRFAPTPLGRCGGQGGAEQAGGLTISGRAPAVARVRRSRTRRRPEVDVVLQERDDALAVGDR